MEFCSEFGYNYGFNGSDDEDISDEEQETKKKVVKKIRKGDSYIIAVKFDQLVLLNETFAGEAKKCQKCQAIMSVFSRENVSSDMKEWTCEFCYEKNDLSGVLASLDEIPKHDDTTFLLEPAPATQQAEPTTAAPSSVKSTDNNYLSFCIDISGSMDTLIPVKDEANKTSETKSMTRLQGVKIACVENIKNLKEEEPNKRVNLTTFSSTVKYFGDGSKVRGLNSQLLEIGANDGGGYGMFGRHRAQPPNQAPSRGLFGGIQAATKKLFSSSSKKSSKSSSGSEPEDEVQNLAPTILPQNEPDILMNIEKLMALAMNQDGNLKSINETHANLTALVTNLRTEGSTALGPGLVFAIGFSSKKPGSQIILCTDGAANVGMGSIGNGNESEKFYEDLADDAKSKGVTVNVISMEGTDCKLALLGKITDRTNGVMNIVNPANLSSQFKSILENRIVATNVQAKLIVNNKYLYIRDEDLETAEGKAIEKNDTEGKEALEMLKKSVIVKDIGNANIDTEITFEYGIRKLKGESQPKNLDELPFQLQITYTTIDGAKAMRVYTKKQKFTTDRDQAERNLRSQNLIYSNACQKMTYQVLSNNIGVAKYRQKQMQQMQMQNNWTSPSAYHSKEAIVQKMSKSTRAEDLRDSDAEEMYEGKKLNRKKL